MKQVRYRRNRGWIFILVLLLGAVAYATPRAATSPHLLRDVWVLHQEGQWHVVLLGSESMPFKTIETSNPPRVVVDLPNTSSKTMITSPIRENEVIDTVKTSTVVHEPQPLTRVEIKLNRVVSYKIRRVQKKIWVTFEDTPPTPGAEASGERLTATEAEGQPSTAEVTKEDTGIRSLAEKKETASPPPRGDSLPLASKILSIEPVTLDQDLDVHIIGDGRLENYDVSLLPDPPRLVVDLKGVKSSVLRNVLTLSGPWVRKVRVGQHADRVRVVFDLGIKLEAELPYQITLEENRLVVSISPSSVVPAQ